MRLVGFLSLLAFVSVGSSSLLGSRKCTWGPSYWCSHVSRAKECGALDHCLQSVWTKQTLESSQSSNTQCQICEKLINTARNMLKNKPVEEVVTFIKTLCNDLPFNQTYRTECINMVEDADTVIKLLQSNMTAKAMCGVFMPCNGFEDNVNHHKQPETNNLVKTPSVVAVTPVKAGNICTDCVNFITDIKNLLTNPNTESQLIGMIKQIVCSQLGSVEAICNDLVDTYVPQGLSILSSYVDPTMTCSAVGFCTGADTEELRTKLRDVKNFVMVVLRKMGVHVTTNALECDACKTVTNDIRNMVRDQTIQRKVVNFVEQNVCANLGELSTMCKQAVEDNYQAVFQLIAGSLIGDQVCVELGMCPNAKGAVKLQLGSIQCEACTYIIEGLSYLEGLATVQSAIRNFIENNVCPALGNAEAQCKTDVDMYSQAVFEILKEILNAGFLCGKMNLCAAPAPKVTSNGALCEVCHAVATEVDTLLDDSSTQAEVEALLDRICARLGANLSAECKSFVDQYTPFVLDMLAQQLDPDTFCKFINLCPAKLPAKSTPPKVKTSIKSGTTCIVCEFVVREVASMLEEKGTEEEIKQKLLDFCGELGSVTDECKTFVNDYFDEVYRLLVTVGENPQQVCAKINLCPAQNSPKTVLPKVKPRLHVVPLSKQTLPTKTFNLDNVGSSNECVFCEMVLTYVAEALKEPGAEKDIKGIMDTVCEKLPAYQQTCENFVNQYGDAAIQWLAQEDDPYVICPKLGLCSSSKTVKKPEIKNTKLYFLKQHIAEKKCEQGPQYWCSSMSRARSCGKVDYCLKKNMINTLV